MKILWPVLTVLMAALIFYSSSMPGDESGEASLSIVLRVQQFIPIDDDLLHFLVRKAAHFTVYAILAFNLANSLKFHMANKKAVLLTAWVGASIYGITDEIHQYFVPGRHMSVMDMGINSAGALLGAVFVYLLIMKTRKEAGQDAAPTVMM